MRLNFIKHLFGWKEIDFSITEPCIIVSGHTSYWDAFVYFLFRISTYGENIYVLGQPKLSKWYLRPISLFLNIIYAPPSENKNNNSLKEIVKIFSSKSSSKNAPKMLFLSPKGTCIKKEWRSGYYYIAKELNYNIYPLCMDFTNRKLVLGTPVNPNTMSLDECTKNLQFQLGQYRGLYIENSEYELTDKCGCPYECLLPFDFCMFTTYLSIPFLIKLVLSGSYFRFGISFILFIYALIYHYHREGVYFQSHIMQPFQSIEGFIAKGLITTHIIENLYMYKCLPSLCYFLFPLALFFYKNGTPRGYDKNRSKYVIFHSIHHILSAILSYILASQS